MKWYIIPIIALLCVILVLGCANKEEKINKELDQQIPQLEEETDTGSIEAPDIAIDEDIDVGDIV